MMKKFLPVLLLIICLATESQAQLLPGFELGLKGALNFSQLKEDGRFFNSDTKAGYQAGLYSRIGVLGFHVQPEVYITGKNTKVTFDDTVGDIKFSSVDIPVLLGKRFGLGPLGARIQTGPVFSFVLDESKESSLRNIAQFENYKKNSTAWAFGAGVDISSLRVDLRYELGLNNISQGMSGSQKLNLWSLGVGYRIFKI